MARNLDDALLILGELYYDARILQSMNNDLIQANQVLTEKNADLEARLGIDENKGAEDDNKS